MHFHTECVTFLLFLVLGQLLPPHGCDTVISNFGYGNVASEENQRLSTLCTDIKPQYSLDTEQIKGVWYGNEIIKHTPDIPGVYNYDTCVEIILEDYTNLMPENMPEVSFMYNSQWRKSTPPPRTSHPLYKTKYWRLLWLEGKEDLEYVFNYTDASPGLWTVVEDQHGTMAVRRNYQQFTGSVQVVKAVQDHLVLTFCGNEKKSNVYSLVLSRQPQGLNAEEIRSIRSLLSRRGLSTDSIRKVCSGSARQMLGISWLLMGVAVLVSRLQRH